MNILEIATSGTIGTPEMGPVSTVICELSNRFVLLGHHVTLADAAATRPRSALNSGVEVLEVGAMAAAQAGNRPKGRLNKILRAWKPWVNSYRYASELAKRVSFDAFDIIHVHDPMLAFLLQRRYRIRCCYTAHTALWSEQADASGGSASPVRLSVGKRFRIGFELDAIKKSRLSVGLNGNLRLSVSGANIETIPNGVDVSQWVPIDRAAARKTLGIKPDEFIVLFIGRIIPVKGVDILLNAVKLLEGSLEDSRTLIIGPLSGSFDTRDNPVTPFARSMIEMSRGLPVQFLGFINNREAAFKNYLAAADVLAVPSLLEPQGLVVLESLAMGTPVIGSNTGGIKDMITEKVGYLFTPGDSAALAEHIRELHDNPDKLVRMQQECRNYVAREFSWEGSAERYLAAFSRCLQADAAA